MFVHFHTVGFSFRACAHAHTHTNTHNTHTHTHTHTRIYIYTYIYIYIYIERERECVFVNVPGDRSSIPAMLRSYRVIPTTKKWYLMSPCSTLSIIKYGSRVKWTNLGKEVQSFPIPRCSSY